MKNVSRYRAMGSLHRQCAVFNPHQSWKHLAEVEISDFFRQCNTSGRPDVASPDATAASLQTIAAA
jgi:hypothetical protein